MKFKCSDVVRSKYFIGQNFVITNTYCSYNYGAWNVSYTICGLKTGVIVTKTPEDDLESINSKETKMEQKTKWYKPWTWFAKETNLEKERMDQIAIDQAQELAVKMEESLTSMSDKVASVDTYTPPRSTLKKKAVKKSASKKKAAKKKRGKK